jgi:hypothetical protein
MASLGPVVAKQYIKKQGHTQSSHNTNHLVNSGPPPVCRPVDVALVPGRAAVPLQGPSRRISGSQPHFLEGDSSRP